MHDLLHDDIPWNSRWVLQGDDILHGDDMDLHHDDIPSRNSRGILHGGDIPHMDNMDLLLHGDDMDPLHDGDTDPLHGDDTDPLHDDDDVFSSCVSSYDVYVRVLLRHA